MKVVTKWWLFSACRASLIKIGLIRSPVHSVHRSKTTTQDGARADSLADSAATGVIAVGSGADDG
jgi:hypothetical protein